MVKSQWQCKQLLENRGRNIQLLGESLNQVLSEHLCLHMSEIRTFLHTAFPVAMHFHAPSVSISVPSTHTSYLCPRMRLFRSLHSWNTELCFAVSDFFHQKFPFLLIVACVSPLFLCISWTILHSVGEHITLLYSSVERNLSCFHFLTDMNNCEHTSVCVYTFSSLLCTRKSGIAASWVIVCKFCCFSRNYHFTFPPKIQEGSNIFTNSTTIFCFLFF